MEKFQCVEIFHDKFLFFSDRISKNPRKSNTHDVLRSLRFTIYEMRKNSFSISLETNACQWGSWILDYHIFIHSHMHTSNSKSNKNAKCHLFGRAQCVWIIPRMMRIQMMCENIMALHSAHWNRKKTRLFHRYVTSENAFREHYLYSEILLCKSMPSTKAFRVCMCAHINRTILSFYFNGSQFAWKYK